MQCNAMGLTHIKDSQLPARVEVPEGVGDIASHGGHNCPFAAQVFDENVRQEHGGYDDGSVDNT